MTTSRAKTQPNGRIIFDENFGRHHVEKLVRDISQDPDLAAEVIHTLTFQEQGVWDESWIPTKAHEGWIVISQDRGKRGRGKGEPLTRVCVKYGVTHVLLSSGAGQRRMHEKMQFVLTLWKEIVGLHSEPRGSRFMLVLHEDGIRPKLVKRQIRGDG